MWENRLVFDDISSSTSAAMISFLSRLSCNVDPTASAAAAAAIDSRWNRREEEEEEVCDIYGAYF
jgi:hypothetical protein